MKTLMAHAVAGTNSVSPRAKEPSAALPLK
jgi:hypothetical protein